jgi:hypothetical protein
MAGALDARGYHMEEKPSQAFDGVQGHRPLSVAVLIVRPPKRHLPLLEGQAPSSRDGEARRRARPRLAHGLGPRQRGLGIDDPVCRRDVRNWPQAAGALHR